jgi:hypothetical protein
MTPEDASRVLGVPMGAPAEEVRDAFRRIARDVHPDRNAGDADAASARFIEATQARDVLLAVLSASATSAESDYPRRGPRPSTALTVTWSLLLAVGIVVSVVGSPFPLTPVEPAVRFVVLAGSAITFALTGNRAWWVLMWVAIVATALEVILFTTFGSLVGMLLLAAPLYGLSVVGWARRRFNSRS